MKIRKHPLVAHRIRRPPAGGWSWIDRRFFREYAERLPPDALLLYCFLVAVGDKDGLSYYADTTIAIRLRLQERAIAQAREDLMSQDLIAYESPLYQVLSLPPRRENRPGSRLTALGEVMREIFQKEGTGSGSWEEERGGRA